MNRFGSPEYTRPTVWVSPRGRAGRLQCPSYSDLLGTVVHSLVLADRTSIRLRFKWTSISDRHRSRYDRLRSIASEAGFRVKRRFETPPDLMRLTGTIDLESRVSRPDIDDLSTQVPISSPDGIAAALIRVSLLSHNLERESFELVLGTQALMEGLRVLCPFSQALGFRVRSYQSRGDELRLQFEQSRTMHVREPLREYLQANNWRILVHALGRQLGLDCEICSPPQTRPEYHYQVGWTPIYWRDRREGQLVVFRGFSSSEFKMISREIGGTAVDDPDRQILFIESSSWGSQPWKRVFRPDRDLSFSPIARIRRPPSSTGFGQRLRFEESIEGFPISLTPLGGGQEIGANSYFLRLGPRGILLDCGLNVGNDEYNPLGLPRMEVVDQLSAILLSHAHTDHVGSVLLAHSLFPSVPIYCTPETGSLLRTSIEFHSRPSFQRMQEEDSGVPLPPLRDWGEMFQRTVRLMPFEKEFTALYLPGVHFQFLRAGHILGAAQIEIVIGARRLLYTGDFCKRDQITVRGSGLPAGRNWDTVIAEATNAAEDRVVDVDTNALVDGLARSLSDTIENHGVAIFPAFALGKAQEVYALVHETLQRHFPQVSTQRILVGGLATQFFQAYSDMSDSTRFIPAMPPQPPRVDSENAAHVIAQLKKDGPHFVVATHGMMMPGTISNKLGVEALKDRASSLVLTGYQAEGTLGGAVKEALRESQSAGTIVREIEHRSLLPNGFVGVAGRVTEVRISGHATLAETLSVLETCNPDVVVAVHGSPEATTSLVKAVNKHLQGTRAYAPVNLETVPLGTAIISEAEFLEFASVSSEAATPQVELNPTALPITAHVRFSRWRFSKDTDYERISRGPSSETEERTVLVWLDPRKGVASVTIEPEGSFPIRRVSRLEVSRVTTQGTESHLIAEASRFNALPLGRLPVSLPPGSYIFRTEIGPTPYEQRVEVGLDFSDFPGAQFDQNGHLEFEIPMMETHIRNFVHAELKDLLGNSPEHVYSNVNVTGGSLVVDILREDPPLEVVNLDLGFSNDYPPSTIRIELRDFSVPEEITQITPTVPVVGQTVTARITRSNFNLESMSVGGGPVPTELSKNRSAISFVFTEPGEYVNEFEVCDSEGNFSTSSHKVSVGPAFKLAERLLEELSPGTPIDFSGSIDDRLTWSNLRLAIEGGEKRLNALGRAAQCQVEAPAEVPAVLKYEVHGEVLPSRVHCTLGRGELRIGYGEKVDWGGSDLVLHDGRGHLVVHRIVGVFDDERVRSIAARFQDWSAEVLTSEDRKRLKIDFSCPLAQSSSMTVTLPYGALRVLNLRDFDVKLRQRRRDVTDFVKPLETLTMAPAQALGTQSEVPGLKWALIQTAPLLEWENLEVDADGNLEVNRLTPGSYVLSISYHRRIAWRREFRVGNGSSLNRPTPSDASVSAEFPAQELDNALQRFIEQNHGTPPSVIGLGAKSTCRMLSGPPVHRELATLFKSGRTTGLTLILTPSNLVPDYVVRALDEAQVNWCVLSYPFLRNIAPMSADDFISQNLSITGANRARVGMRRAVPASIVNSWSPVMKLPCPACGKDLVVDLADNPPRTYCNCGFSSNRVFHTLEDVKNRSVQVFVFQYNAFRFLTEGWRQRFGGRLEGGLRCRVCGYRTPFRSQGFAEALAQRMRMAHPGMIRGDLPFFLRTGWWTIRRHEVLPSSKCQLVLNGHCPDCCAGEDATQRCRNSMLTDDFERSIVLLAGLEALASAATNAYSYAEPTFPEYMFPGLDDPTDAFSKVKKMVDTANVWWEGG
jgi:Cft2 family RNA processing exonuclease